MREKLWLEQGEKRAQLQREGFVLFTKKRSKGRENESFESTKV